MNSMNRLQTIIAYLCMSYPFKGELSKARLTKLVYLADWYSALADNRQLTDIRWHFNHYGPYVPDIVDSARKEYGFDISSEQTLYGDQKQIISFNGYLDGDTLSPRDKQILDAAMTNTKSLYFNDFIDFIYSTYPVASKNRYSDLDLVRLANEFKDIQRRQHENIQ